MSKYSSIFSYLGAFNPANPRPHYNLGSCCLKIDNTDNIDYIDYIDNIDYVDHIDYIPSLAR